MVKTPPNAAKRLGDELRAIRQVRNLSLAAVAEPAKISAAYLQKLESGIVKNPSPRVLMRLAQALDCEYDRLMELAGYVTAGRKEPSRKATFLEAALRNEQLTDDEQRAVLAFIAYLKGMRAKE